MKKVFLSLSLLLLGFCAKAQYENYWEADSYLYANNMTVTGVICFNDEEQRSESLEIGAFCGNECRGSSIAVYEEILDRYFIYMMIYGEHNDEIAFRCYDHKLNLELDLIQDASIDFQVNAVIGGVVDPFIFSFKTYQYKISLDILPEMGGVANGEGTYDKYDTCFISVSPNDGYQFGGLIENGDTLTKQDNYSFIVLSDRNIVAEFILQEFEISLSAMPDEGGTVSGEGVYKYGTTVYAIANPNDDYAFMNWTDDAGSILTTNPQYVFDVTESRSLIANFAYVDNVSENNRNDFMIYPNPASEFIIIKDDSHKSHNVVIYDLTGKIILKKHTCPENNRIDISNITNGIYVISIDNVKSRFVINK